MDTELTMRERLNRYELAQETIGFMMAACSADIFEEEKKAASDAMKIAHWQHEFNRLAAEQDDLRLNDDAAIQHVLDVYCPRVKARFEAAHAAA